MGFDSGGKADGSKDWKVILEHVVGNERTADSD